VTSRTLVLAVVLATGVTLSGCDQIKKLVGGGKPTGQVVATVDGEEITALELRQELGNFTSRDPAVMKRAQQQALQQIIMRRILVDKAKEQKLDKTADYSLQLRRGEENLLVQLYQRKIAASLAVPSRQEAEDYIAANPDKFTNRRVLIVDQVISAPSKIPPERFRPLNTLEEVRALLDAESVPYQVNVATLDTLTMDPRLLAEINKLPAGEVFVLPRGQALLFNRIADARSAPFGGEPARNYAINTLRSERAQKAVVQQVEVLRKGAEQSITYSDAFKPPPPPKAQPKAAPPAPPPK
jgi:EpsD family peptidyl-prolyl cis-trans isomerase